MRAARDIDELISTWTIDHSTDCAASDIARIIARHAPTAPVSSNDLHDYPNLEAIVHGCISGYFRDWPLVASELKRYVASRTTPPADAVTDTEVVDFLEANMTRFTTYTEPEANGDWHRLEYWERLPLKKSHKAIAGPSIRSTVIAAIRAAKQGGAE